MSYHVQKIDKITQKRWLWCDELVSLFQHQQKVTVVFAPKSRPVQFSIDGRILVEALHCKKVHINNIDHLSVNKKSRRFFLRSNIGVCSLDHILYLLIQPYDAENFRYRSALFYTTISIHRLFLLTLLKIGLFSKIGSCITLFLTDNYKLA